MEPAVPLSNLPLTTTMTTIFDCTNASFKPPRPLTAGNVDYIIQHYIFPIQFIFGVCGNSLNLLVLLSSSMKNQVRTFPPFFLLFFLPFTVIEEKKHFLLHFRPTHSSQQWHLLTQRFCFAWFLSHQLRLSHFMRVQISRISFTYTVHMVLELLICFQQQRRGEFL